MDLHYIKNQLVKKNNGLKINLVFLIRSHGKKKNKKQQTRNKSKEERGQGQKIQMHEDQNIEDAGMASTGKE